MCDIMGRRDRKIMIGIVIGMRKWMGMWMGLGCVGRDEKIIIKIRQERIRTRDTTTRTKSTR